jgi:P4 family phage/plasmid primase-like protien
MSAAPKIARDLSPLDAARLCASLGWPVLQVWNANAGVCQCPDGRDCKRPGKHPTTKNGRDDATTDLPTLNRWFRGQSYNMGIACGPAGLIVIDVDTPRPTNGNADGHVQLAELECDLGPLPRTPNSRTGSGGTHRLFHAPAGVALISKAASAIDIKHNGYIVAPPSVHVSGGIYHWLPDLAPDEVPLAELPPAWVEYLRKPEVKARPTEHRTATGCGFYDALESLDQRYVLECVSGTWLVNGERFAFKPTGRGKHNLLVDRGDGWEGCRTWIDSEGRIGAPDTGKKDGGPLASHWIRWYGGTDEDIRRGLIEIVPALARFAPRERSSRDDIPSPGDAAPDAPDDIPPPAGKRKKRGGDVGLATDYVAKFATHPDGPTLRRWRGDWYRWSADRGHYAAITDESLDSSLFRDFGMNRHQDVRDVRHSMIAVDGVLIDHANIGDMLDGTSGHDPLDVAACANGLLHLPTRTLAPATPCYFATTSLGAAYDPAAPRPKRWIAFLRQIWPDRVATSDDGNERTELGEESIATLQEWFGYMLTPDTRQQKIMLLVGPRRSGKGTIGRVLHALLGGDQAVAAPTLASLSMNFGLWPLIGKMAAIIGDARLGARSDIAQVVAALLGISGEDLQTIDRKHREPWTGQLSTRITINTNELPRFADASDALAGRMVILELGQSFYGREDTGLTDALLDELPGILTWAIEGWMRLRRRGRFAPPTSSTKLQEDLEDLASPVAAWVRERCIKGPHHEVLCSAAYDDYRLWCEREGHTHKVTLQTFGRDLKTVAGVERRQKTGGHRWYRGVALRGFGS